MNTTKPRNKRTVPIRFNQDESYKYKSSSKKPTKVQFLTRHNHKHKEEQNYDSCLRNDHNLAKDEQPSSHQYMQSSYMKTQQDEQEEVVSPLLNVQTYEEQEFQDMYGYSGTSHNFKHQMKGTNNPYELTFKKAVSNQNDDQLFISQNQDYSMPKQPSKNGFDDFSQSFEEVPFSQSKENNNYPNNPQSLAQARQQLFYKYYDALVNLHYLKSRTSKDIEQKHKEHLYSLLVNQLQKNILINGLRVNWVKGKKINQIKGKQYNKMTLTESRKQQKGQRRQPLTQSRKELKGQRRQLLGNTANPKISQSKKNSHMLNKSHLNELQPKIVIFEQITYGIMKRKIFDCFDLIITCSKISLRQRNSQHPQQDNDEEEQNNLNQSSYSNNYDLSNFNDSQQQSQYDNQSMKDSKHLAVLGLADKKRQELREKVERQGQGHKLRQGSPYDKYRVSDSRQSQPYNNSLTQSHLNHKKPKKPSSRSHNHQINSKNIGHPSNNNEISQYDNQHNSEDHELQQEQYEDQQQESQELQRMKQLIQYIESLKKEGRDTDSQLRRYFIKWKIYMLQGILEEYEMEQYRLDEEQAENRGEAEEGQAIEGQEVEGQEMEGDQAGQDELSEDEYNMRTQRQSNNSDQQQQPINIYHNPNHHPQSLTQKEQPSNNNNYPSKNHKHLLKTRNSKNPSQLSKPSNRHQQDNDDQIKQKKLTLKSYLYQTHLNTFWTCFTDTYTNRKLLIATDKVRQQQLKRKVFQALVINIEQIQRQKAMDFYYEEITEQQDLSQYKVAELNYRTNLKTKYFFQLVKTCKHLKCLKALDRLTIKITFLKIKTLNQGKRRKEQNIHRHFSILTTKALFKSFQAWKNSTVLSSSYQKLKLFNQGKEKLLMQQYFSVLQILYKQSLVRQRKAVNHNKCQKLSKAFTYLKFISSQSRQINKKQGYLKQYLTFSRGKQFYQQFYQFYGQRILEHRLNIKAQKLYLNRQKQQVYEKLQQWRNFVIKKQSYRAIEYRLVRLREKQTKGKVMDVWLRELDNRVNRKDQLEQSAQHKDWLVKYYGSLCDIATSGKQQSAKRQR